jgi:AcrR family transcriptional regulator
LEREALSRDRILRAALQIVDKEGLEAISMRRLGQALGVEAMSLYNHVSNKAAILDGIFETVLEELPPAKRSSSWPAVLREQARSLRRVLSAHPNVLPIFATRPAVTPASIARLEAALELLRGEGFSVRAALSTVQVMVAYVVGHTLATHAPGKAHEGSWPDYDALSDDVFPRVREAARILRSHDEEREFEFGLDALVAGLEARSRRSKR